MPSDYEIARPNETKTIRYLEDTMDVYGDGWKEVAESLLGYLSDDEVREWTRYFGIEDEVFGEDEEE